MKADWSIGNLKVIVENSKTQKEVLFKLNLRNAGSNFKTLKKYLKKYNISIEHFDVNYHKMVENNKNKKILLEEILIENSSYNRGLLKKRLYEEGLLKRECIICGQDENWKGMKIALILDHINGIYNDNRLENLRIVCPNCNAGLDTFCGRNLNKKNEVTSYCGCGNNKCKSSSKCLTCHKMDRRKVIRPSLETLMEDIDNMGYSATGRKYGVSDNSIRKWVNYYNKK